MGRIEMDVKKKCLKVWPVLVCLLFLIILLSSFVYWHIPATVVEASRLVVTTSGSTGDGIFPTTATIDAFITVSPSSGIRGSTVNITGVGFMPGSEARIWFDDNPNMVYDPGETMRLFVTTYDGSFPVGIDLMVPSVPAGNYHIVVRNSQMDIETAFENIIEVSAEFQVTEPSPTLILLPNPTFIVITPPTSAPPTSTPSTSTPSTSTPPTPTPPAPTQPTTSVWVWIYIGILVVAVISALLVKNRLDRINREKTETKFKNGDIEIRVNNVLGKPRIKGGTPLQADKPLNIRLVKDPGRQSIKVKGPLVRDRKEDK